MNIFNISKDELEVMLKEKKLTDVIAVKFCKKALPKNAGEEKQSECFDLIIGLFRKEDGQVDTAVVDKLSSLTNKTEEEIMEILAQSCPSCQL